MLNINYFNINYLFQAIFSLGMAIFKALDFGSNAGEEIALLPDLEALITLMTNCNRGKYIFSFFLVMSNHVFKGRLKLVSVLNKIKILFDYIISL